MLLGDLLERLDDEAIATETLLGLDDLGLVTAVRARAEAAGVSVGEFTAATVRRYVDHASDEEWVTLIGAMSRVSDPGQVCLKRALAHGLAAH